jgi:hypothetical protein
MTTTSNNQDRTCDDQIDLPVDVLPAGVTAADYIEALKATAQCIDEWHSLRLEEQLEDDRLSDPEMEGEGQAQHPALAARLNCGKPEILLVPGQLAHITDQAEDALIQSGLGVYQRGGAVVKPAYSTIVTANGDKLKARRIASVSAVHIRELFSIAATWKREGKKGQVPADPPKDIAETYLQRTEYKLPHLKIILDIPTLRADGSILDTPGFDERSGILLEIPKGHPRVPETPTRDDARAALALILDLIKTWPFVGPADRSVALSAILSAMVRHSLETVPFHAISATVRGSGKSLLVDVVSILMTGRRAAVVAQSDTDTEFEKRLNSALMAGDPLISIDNIERPLGGEYLCQVLTQPRTKVRILGESKMVEVPGTMMCGTGNHFTPRGDMSRRCLQCGLDPKTEHPEDREFSVDVLALAKEKRAEYVVAALTILRAYVVAGSPKQSTSLGSFEGWSRMVRDAIIWLGEPDPVATMKEIQKDDPERMKIVALMDAWEASFKDAGRTVAAAIDEAVKAHTKSLAEGKGAHPLREALLTVAGSGGTISAEAFGKWLRSMKDRIVSDRYFTGKAGGGGVNKWSLHNAASMGATASSSNGETS